MEQQTDILWIQRYANFHKGTMKMAFEDGLISDHDNWRKMAKSRNALSHVYDEEEVLPIVRLIYSDYAPLLKQLDKTLEELSQNQAYQQT